MSNKGVLCTAKEGLFCGTQHYLVKPEIKTVIKSERARHWGKWRNTKPLKTTRILQSQHKFRVTYSLRSSKRGLMPQSCFAKPDKSRGLRMRPNWNHIEQVQEKSTEVILIFHQTDKQRQNHQDRLWIQEGRRAEQLLRHCGIVAKLFTVDFQELARQIVPSWNPHSFH